MVEIDETWTMEKLWLNANLVKEIFLYGSRLYGTADNTSDFDYVVILKDGVNKTTPIIMDTMNNHNIHLYSEKEFILKILNHDIIALECLFLNSVSLSSEFKKLFVLDRNTLRESISTLTSHSWIKGKKKLIVSGDYDKKAGLKSIFHSIRILDYAIQFLNTYDGINANINKENMNWLWFELKSLGEKYDHDELWNVIDSRYRELYNKTKSIFKSLAPKSLEIRDKQHELVKILKLHNCHSVDLVMEIMNIFKE